MIAIDEAQPLVSLLEDDEVSEIIINDDKNIFFEKNGCFHQHNLVFEDYQNYKLFVNRLTQKAKIQYDLNTPCADGYLEPFRIHLIAPPLSCSLQLTLRRLKSSPWTFSELIKKQWAQQEQIQMLLDIVNAKKNTLIIGPTGTGKTSCINAVLSWGKTRAFYGHSRPKGRGNK